MVCGPARRADVWILIISIFVFSCVVARALPRDLIDALSEGDQVGLERRDALLESRGLAFFYLRDVRERLNSPSAESVGG